MGTEDAIVFTTGHQANVGTLGTILGPGDTVVADSGDHASILDGCLLSRAKLRAFRHNRLDKLERHARARRRRRRRRPRRRRRRVLDGGRRRRRCPRSADLCERFGARLMVDEAHGAGVLGARGAGAAELLRRRGPRRPAHGDVLEVAGQLRRLPRRAGRRHRVPAHPEPRLPVHRLGGARPPSAPPWRRCGSCARPRAARSWPRSWPTRAYWSDGLVERGFKVVAPRRSSSPRSSPSSSRTTGRPALLWRRSTTPACSSTRPCTRPSRRAARCCARA